MRTGAYAPVMWREDTAIELRPGLPTELKSVGHDASSDHGRQSELFDVKSIRESCADR